MSATCKGRVIVPLARERVFVNANNATNPVPVWASATTYTLGQEVSWAAQKPSLTLPDRLGPLGSRSADLNIWRSLVPGNVGTQPGSDPSKWAYMRPSNPVAMLRWPLNEKTRREGGLTIEVSPLDFCDSLCLFGLEGETLVVTQIDPATGDPLEYTRTVALQQHSVTTLLEYLYQPFVKVDRAVLDELILLPGQRLRIEVQGDGECAIGGLFLGRQQEIGAVQMGPTWGIQEYLSPVRDEFGTLTDLRQDGPFSSVPSYVVHVERQKLPLLTQTLEALRSTPAVWVLDGGVSDYSRMHINLAVYERFEVVISAPTVSTLSLSITSLT